MAPWPWPVPRRLSRPRRPCPRDPGPVPPAVGSPPSEPLLTGADLPLRLEIIQIPNSMLGREVPGQAAVVVQAAVELRLVFGPKLAILL